MPLWLIWRPNGVGVVCLAPEVKGPLLMILLSQLNEVAVRFSGDVGEVREFLVQQGISVGSVDALPALCRELDTDVAFRRDVASLLRAVLYREHERTSYMELLGILVAAAAGTGEELETAPPQAAVRELLRFVMQARKAAGGHVEVVEPEKLTPVVVVPEVREPVVQALPYVSQWSDEEETVETPWWRRSAFAGIGVLGVLLGLGAGIFWHTGHGAGSGTAAVTAPAVANRAAAAIPVVSGAARVVVTPPKMATGRRMISARKAGGRGGLRERVAAPAATVAAAPMHIAPVRVEPAPVVAERAAPKAYATGTSSPPADSAVRSVGVPAVAAPVERRAGKGLAAAAPSVPASPNVAAAAKVDPYAVPPLLRRGEVVDPDREPEERKSAEGGVVRPVEIGMMAANVMYSPAPLYPPAASAAGVQGEVTVRAVVDTEGNVKDARVISGPAPLRDAALEAVQHWRYQPYKQGGRAIPVETTAVVDFQLP